MTGKSLRLFAAPILAIGLALATTAFAEPDASVPGASTAPTEQTGADRTQQMTAMMDRCHRMMQSMHRTPSSPETK